MTSRSATPEKSASTRRVLIVGNGMVSHRLCQRLCSDPNHSNHKIVVLGEEPYPAYDRIRLSQSLDQSLGDLALSPSEWYAQSGIELRTGARVVEIDRQAQLVRTQDDCEFFYDTLVLATGSDALRPPIDGIDDPSVQVLRTLEDLQVLRDAVVSADSAAVIGGGLLGLEAAKVLKDAGLGVHVLEASAQLMPRQLDADSARVLRSKVEALGVQTHLEARTTRIARDEHGFQLDMEGGTQASLRVDRVVVAAGIRPRDELARRAGLDVGARGGIIVDDGLQTSDPNIYAIGECALHRGRLYGLVAPGYAMADALARRLTGKRAKFVGGDTSCHLKVLGVPVSAVGLYDQEFTLVGTDVADGRRSLLLDGRRLVGATCVGSWDDLPRVHDAVVNGKRLGEQQLRRFKRDGELWPSAAGIATWPAATVICNCTGVTRGQLSLAMAETGPDVEQLARCTGASSVCGSCKPLLAQLAGAPPTVSKVPGRTWVMGTSLAALVLAIVHWAFGPIPFADSVQVWLHGATKLWQDPLLKQISGYTLTGLAALGGVLSLRKRVRWFSLGSFGYYRALHTAVGSLSLLVLLGHTGMRFGANLNMALMSLFVALAAIGALTGLASGMEAGISGRFSAVARLWRPRLTLLHLLLFWPLPILLGLHIFSVYYF